MFSFITGLNPKVYLVAALLLFTVSTAGYINNLQSNLEDKEVELKTTSLKLDEANKNNELIIQAYEKTLAIEKEIATQKAITQEQKEVVVTKYKTLIKEVEKRGEIKQDEKSNFTIVTF
jgi:CO dehydrogenase/acetyl-CoA synthase delta subunit